MDAKPETGTSAFHRSGAWPRLTQFRTVFYWPMTLQVATDAEGHSAEESLRAQFRALRTKDSPWKPVNDSLLHLPRVFQGDDAQAQQVAYDAAAYGEFAYFHDFVQRALFGSTSDPEGTHPLLLLQRHDVTGLSVDFGAGDATSTLDFAVERLNLYLLRPGVAVLSLQVSLDLAEGTTATLDQVMTFNDGMRRSHVPYYFKDGKGTLSAGGRLPERVRWKRTDKPPKEFDLDGPVEPSTETGNAAEKPLPAYRKLMDSAPTKRQMMPVRHWQWLLNGDAPENPIMPLEPAKGRRFHWRHFADDRLPIATTIIFCSRRDYYDLQEGQWMRLAFVDPPGKDPYPYEPAFLKKTFDHHCYDRYHFEENEATEDAPTRYLMSDYALTAVTYRKEDRTGKDNSYADDIAMHMQRHYYQTFLLGVVDKAVMLMLSSQISAAVEAFDKARQSLATSHGAEPRLSTTMQGIERDFLHYAHRFRFTGVSGQLQAGEMHAQLRSVMNLDAMFDDLRSELDMAVGFLAAREAQHTTQAAERLNVIATLGIVLALVMGFFSMNIVTSETLLLGEAAASRGIWHHLAWLGGGIFVAFGGAFWLLQWVSCRSGDDPRTARPSQRLTQNIMLWTGIAGLALLLVSKILIWSA